MIRVKWSGIYQNTGELPSFMRFTGLLLFGRCKPPAWRSHWNTFHASTITHTHTKCLNLHDELKFTSLSHSLRRVRSKWLYAFFLHIIPAMRIFRLLQIHSSTLIFYFIRDRSDCLDSKLTHPLSLSLILINALMLFIPTKWVNILFFPLLNFDFLFFRQLNNHLWSHFWLYECVFVCAFVRDIFRWKADCISIIKKKTCLNFAFRQTNKFILNEKKNEKNCCIAYDPLLWIIHKTLWSDREKNDALLIFAWNFIK